MADAQQQETDAVIVGGGAAGLSAALTLARARRDVVLVDAGNPRNARARGIHGLPTRDGISPEEYRENARSEILGYGGEIVDDDVVAVHQTPDADEDRPGFLVRLRGGTALRARRVVMAAGIVDRLPEVDGLAEGWGRGVVHCPYCHAYELRDRRIGVLAADAESALHQALLLRQWTAEVVVLLHEHNEHLFDEAQRRLLTARDVEVVSGRIRRVVVEDGEVVEALLEDGAAVPLGGLFVSPSFELDLRALAQLRPDTVETPLGTAMATDGEGRTSVPGLRAAGNVADLSALVLGAAELGARAAIGINGELVLEDAEAAAEDDGRDQA